MKIINIEVKFEQPLMKCEVKSSPFMENTEHSKQKLRDKKDVVERYFDFLLKENEFEIKSNFVEDENVEVSSPKMKKNKKQNKSIGKHSLVAINWPSAILKKQLLVFMDLTMKR